MRYISLLAFLSAAASIGASHFGYLLPVGAYVIILGFWVAIMTIWPPNNKWSKAIWIAVIFAFTALEIQNLYRAKAESDATSERQQKAFSDLLTQGNVFLGRLLDAVAASQEAASFASGGDSYPRIDPFVSKQEDGIYRVGFIINKTGKYPLYGLSVYVGRAYRNPGQDNSIISAGHHKQFLEMQMNISTTLFYDTIPTEPVAYYYATMFARNGHWKEVIEFRKVGPSQLSWRYVLYSAEHYGIFPMKKLLDLADNEFPQAFRHKTIYPLETMADLPFAPQ